MTIPPRTTPQGSINPDGATLRSMTTSHAVDHWLGELERKGHSERTIDTYRRFLEKLADENPHIDVDEWLPASIRRFLDKQSRKKDGARKSAATIAQNVTIICEFFDWLTFEGIVKNNPTRRNGQRILSRPRQVPAHDNANVTTVSGSDVARLLDEVDRTPHKRARRLAVYVAVLTGARRKALAEVRLEDYDPRERTLTFHEKGGKTIEKPVPDELAEVILDAVAAGVYESTTDYLIPGRARQRRDGTRDSRVIWHLIKDAAEDAGVKSHVHALRAAYAVEYLETHAGQIEALKELMGHRRVETTTVYLRRLEKRQAMETVRDLSFGRHRSPQNAPKLLEANPVTEKEGFEPSFDALRLLDRARTQRAACEPSEEAKT